MSEIARWVAGAAAAALVAGGARAGGALRRSGAAAAAVLGTVAVGAGWDWGILLVAYFVSSSALSRLRAADRQRLTEGRIEKGGARDAIQVLANGGLFGVAALAYATSGDPFWRVLGAASLAASAADTWATEIGTLSRSAARSILTGRAVPPGTSGGVTVLGLAASVAGAAFVGGVVSALGWDRGVVNAVVAGGVIGSLIDSLLGASVQAGRWCSACSADTEQRVHHCGTRTQHVRGIAWLDNDGVNAVSTLGGAVTGALLAWTT